MNPKTLASSLIVLLASVGLYGQTASVNPAATETASKTPSVHNTYAVDPLTLNLNLVLPPPPARDSAITTAEFAELHRIEATRTPAQIAQAQADDHEEDIFIFKTVLGPDFTAKTLPITAALSAYVRKNESASGGPLKNFYRRPRPYQVDSTLTLSTHSTRNLLRIPAAIRSLAICSPSLLCSWCPRSGRRSSPVSMSTFTTV
jgi:acid phosphatase (class A)